MEVILAREFDEICQKSKVIKFGRSLEQPKIFETQDNTIIKLFYSKRRRFSSDKFKPYAIRFCRNIARLRAHGYSVPQVTQIKYCAERKIYLVYYKKIPGIDIRSYAKTHDINFISQVIKLLADLHQNGVFFRCIHLENLLKQADNKIALLDIVDVRFKNHKLSIHTRLRNIKHLLRDPNDKELWQTYGIQKFLNEYFASAKLGMFARFILSRSILKAVR